MKNLVKKILVHLNIYLPVKYSVFYRIYVTLFRKDIIAAEKKEVAFYKSFLDKCDLILDIGAYDGHKTSAFLHFAKKMICCEPDSFNYSILRTRFRFNNKVIVKQVALSNTNGFENFNIHQTGSAFNTLSEKWKEILKKDGSKIYGEQFTFPDSAITKVPTITLNELIAEYGTPDFIKIDVEGYEKKVLQGLSKKIKCLSFEANLPEFFNETAECIGLLNNVDQHALFNYSIDEHLQLSAFIPGNDLLNIFSSDTKMSCEIICKMID
ncbi:MAG TPA: FkbM family methyltransferase [Puia sp.]|jgi:FkbM family methyltransferase|nr:FkbM family methyltransferase [Puia sp.]